MIELLKDVVNTIGISNYYNAVKKIYHEHPISDEGLLLLTKLDYSKIDNKYAYFKKCYLNFNDNFLLAYDFALFLYNKSIITDINLCIKSFGNKIEKYKIEKFLIAFDYSYNKIVQLSESIVHKDLYFFKTLNNNLEKMDSLNWTKEDILDLKKKYNMTIKK